jgi:hypothetical protein
VYGLDGTKMNTQRVELTKPSVRGDFVMHSLDKTVFPWKYIKFLH